MKAAADHRPGGGPSTGPGVPCDLGGPMHEVRPSSTARLVARCLVYAAHDRRLRALVPDDAREPLLAMLRKDGSDRWWRLALRQAWSRSVLGGLERVLLPGIIAHFAARKRWIERAVVEAVDRGCSQVVVLGAGLDTLAFRLHRTRPDVLFFELDHPASQAPKAAALRRLEMAGQVSLVPLNLADQLPVEVLGRHPRFAAGRRTCFLAEGLLMYLPQSRAVELLQDLARCAGAQVVWSFMEPDDGGRPAFRGGSPLIGPWLRSRGEPFRWALQRTELPSFLEPLCLRVAALAGAAELREEILVPAGLAAQPLARGECLVVAREET